MSLLNEPSSEETDGKSVPIENDITNMSDLLVSSKPNLDEEEEEDEPKETEELMAKGNMKKSLFWNYFKNGGSIFLLIAFGFSTILAQFAASGTDYWVAVWSVDQRIYSNNKLNLL